MNHTAITLAILTTVKLCTAGFPSPPSEPVKEIVHIVNGDEVIITDVEDYVTMICANEMPHTFEDDALKAQAVAARTYIYYCLENYEKKHDNADFCTDPTHCIGIMTEDKLKIRFGEEYAKTAMNSAGNAAEATAGEIMVYDGSPILALWHSSSYGCTEDCGEVFMQSLPYLISVTTPEAKKVSAVSFSLSDVTQILKNKGYNHNGKFTLHIEKTPSGRCKTLTVGNIMLSGREARDIFALRSCDISVSLIGGRIYFFVKGYGHGIGMSQYGANDMAKNGADYENILTHYYQGAELYRKK